MINQSHTFPLRQGVTFFLYENQIYGIVKDNNIIVTDWRAPISSLYYDSEVGKTSYNIYIDIIVDRDSLKKIVIGKNGKMIKEIGVRTRPELERLLNKNVYLNLRVKTVKDWRDKEKYLNEYGFNDFME